MSDSYHELLCGYSAYLRRAGHDQSAEIALRTRSRAIRDVIAYVATRDQYNTENLHKFVESGTLPNTEYRYNWLATLGRVCALQAFHASDLAEHNQDIRFGLACLQHANLRLPKDKQHQHFHKLQVELLARAGYIQEARRVLDSHDSLNSYYYGYLRTDLNNPAISGTNTTYETWLEGFNRQFLETGIAPIRRSKTYDCSFNSLSTKTVQAHSDGPKVSVILTSYKPSGRDFQTAVNSILEQSYRNFELLIVDDASPTEFDSTLERVAASDSRVRLIKLPVNGGTYRARNAGIEAATGEFLTGQDSDDWSHPERLANQVDHMLKHPHSTGVVVEAVRMNDDLVRTFPGRLPDRLCEVSLMLRTKLAHKVRGYVDARKGADSEFRRRIEMFCGRPVDFIKKPLYLTRIGNESLSAADFKPGWSHPVRRAFWNATQHWHEKTSASELTLQNKSTGPIPIPNRFKIIAPTNAPNFDVVFVNDWRSYGNSQRAMIDEIATLLEANYRVAVMQLESIRSPSTDSTRLCEEIQDMINARAIQEVIPDENASTQLLIIHDPSILQFSPHTGVNLETKLTLIIAETASRHSSNAHPLYLVEDCNQIAGALFKGKVIWTARDPAILRHLKETKAVVSIHSKIVPVVFHSQNWKSSRTKLSSNTPVLGRPTENHESLWPNHLESINALWPAEGNTEIRILGDARAFLRKFNLKHYPLDWVVFRDQEIKPEAFMRSIDFFVYFPGEQHISSYCREALEALAAGAVVILPENFRETHQDTAIYAPPAKVPGIIEKYATDSHAFREHVQAASSALDTIIDNNAFVHFIGDLVATYDLIDGE